jgi:hypothetical protein
MQNLIDLCRHRPAISQGVLALRTDREMRRQVSLGHFAQGTVGNCIHPA